MQKKDLKSKLKEGIDYIECKLCKKRLKFMGSHLSSKHGMHKEEYLEQFPNALIVCKKSSALRSTAQTEVQNRPGAREGRSRKVRETMGKISKTKKFKDAVKKGMRANGGLEKLQALGESRKGIARSEESVAKQKASMAAMYEEYPEVRKQISKTLRETHKAHPEIRKQVGDKLRGRKKSPESIAKTSAGLKKHYETHDGPWKGREHSEETIELMQERQKEVIAAGEKHIPKGEEHYLYGKHLSEKTIKKMQKSKSKAILAGKVHGKVTSFYSRRLKKKIVCRSSWEEKVYKFLEECFEIKMYNPEPIAIPYLGADNKMHYYHPDVLIEYFEGVDELIEIKPAWAVKKEINIRKTQAAVEYCKEAKNMKFVILTEEELFNKDLSKVDFTKSKILKSWHGKLDKLVLDRQK